MGELASVHWPLMYLRAGHVLWWWFRPRRLPARCSRPTAPSWPLGRSSWLATSWLDGPPILPYPRRLLRKAPKAVRLGDPEQRPRPLLQGHPGGRGAEPRRRHRGGRAFGMKSSRAEDFVAAIKHRFVYSTSFSIPELFPGFTGILSSSLA
ncbi:hypothetical protein VPH35_049855 [Triticum aestivum]